MATILLVEDDANARRLMAIALARAGHEVETVASVAEAERAIATRRPDLVLTDLRMEGRDAGLEVLHLAKRRHPEVPVALITAYATAETAVAAMKEGAFDYLTKPVAAADLVALVERALARTGARPEEPEVAASGVLVGESEAMVRVRERLLAAARTDYTVLITGESGTGKEMAARFIHQHSARRTGPFVPVNCGAIPEELFEAELFGHRKGAFTGAEADRPGLFEEASGGTLFLDEVGELPAKMQVKLLRALQEGSIRRVGDTRERKVDVRVIAATNRDLAGEVEAGRFREDLFFRLNVLPIHMPPLRARLEDLPLLARSLLARWGEDPARLTDEALEALARYPFPGNVRELENALQRMLALAPPGAPLTATDVREALGMAQATEAGDLDSALGRLDAWLADQERRAILYALKKTGGNLTRAAKLLGISFRSLRYRVDKLGIDAERLA
ncbi:MAG: sigma-54-dependent Fis family transcriptional regulator [Zetaproteobacteria bacterium]|nr:MAG: sigma-54-dependent Fis family transcriptional regulator [Zetaproteobacteria bacterium]